MSVEPNPQDARAPSGREPVAADFIIPLIGSGLVGYYLINTTELVWEAKVTGVCVGVVLLALCLMHMGRLLLQIGTGAASFSFGGLFSDTPFNRQRLGLVLLAATFIVTIRFVGTTLGVFLLLIAAMWLMGVRSIVTLLCVAFAASATVYVLLIWLLSSRLPQGPVEQLLAPLFGGS